MEKKKLKALAIHRRLTGRDPETGLPVNQADAAAGTVRSDRNSGQVRQDFQSGMTGKPQSALGVTMGDVTVTPMDAAGAPARTTGAVPGWDAGSAAVWAGTIVPSLKAGHTTALSPQYDPSASGVIAGRARQSAGAATKRLDAAPSQPLSDTGRVEMGVSGARAEQAFSDEAHRRRESADMTIAGQLRRARQRLAELQSKLSDRRRSLVEENPGLHVTAYGSPTTPWGSLAFSDPVDTGLMQNDTEARALSHSIAEVEEQIRLLESKKFNDEHAGGGWDAVRRFGHSAGQAFMDEGLNTVTFGMPGLSDASTRLAIQRKVERGEALTPEEEDALADEMETQQVEARVGDLGNAYTWGQITGASPWFMAQFLGTGGGFSALGSRLGTRLARKLAERGARRAALEGGESLGMRLAEGGLMRFARQGGRKAFSRLAAEQGRLGAASIAATRMLGVGATALAVRAPLMAGTVQSGQTASKVIETKLGPVVADEATGELRYEDAKGWGEAAWQAGMDQVIENASEMGLMNPLGLKASDVARLVGARRLTAMLLRSTREGAGTVLSKTAELMRRGGLQGYMEEVGEEYSGQLWRTMLGLESAYTTDETGRRVNLLATGDFHGDIWAGLALSMGMTAGTAAAAGYGVRGAGALQDAVCRRRMAHRVETASAAASAAFGADQWEAMRMAIDATDNADFGRLAGQVAADTEMSGGQKAAVMDYMERVMQMRGDGLRRYVEQRDGMAQAAASPEAREAAQAWSDGYEATEAGEMQDVRRELDFQRTRLAGLMGLSSADEVDAAVGADAVGFAEAAAAGWRPLGGQAGGGHPGVTSGAPTSPGGNTGSVGSVSGGRSFSEAAMDYAVARMAYEGMIRRVQDDIEVRVRESDAQVQRRTNPATGAVQRATLKAKDADGNDRTAYVVGGTVAMLADGSGVDTRASDASIAILDGETGKVEMVSPDALLRVEEPVDAATLRAGAAEQIRQQLSQEAADRIDGVLHFNAGDRYVLTGADGHQVEAVVTANEAGLTDNGDGTVNVSTDGGQTVAPMAKTDLQAMSDATLEGRVAGFEAQRAERNAQQEAEQSHAYELNEEVTVRDAAGNWVTGVVTNPEWTDGTVLVQVDTPQGPRVFPYTREELDRARAENEGGFPTSSEDTGGSYDNNGSVIAGEDIQPSGRGVLGNIYAQFKGKAKAAIEFLRKKKEGVALGALHHDEIGDIDLAWGNDRMGLAHILHKHPGVLDGLQDRIDEMQVISMSDNRIVLESPTHKAVVSKMLGEEKTPQWLLTAYEKKNASGGSSDIDPEPAGMQNGTAPLQDTLHAGKGSESGETLQAVGGRNSVAGQMALSYLLEGGKGSILSSDYFLHAMSAAFPALGIQIEDIRGRAVPEIAPSPMDYVRSGHPSLHEIRGLVQSTYGQQGVSVLDKLLANADGFNYHDGKAVGREIEALNAGDGVESEGKVLDVTNDSLPLQAGTNEANDGTTVPEPVSQGERGTEAPQDARMEEAAAQLRARIEAADRDAQASGGTLSGRLPQEIEQRAAESYAKENGLWIPLSETFAWHPLPSGNENNVYLNTEDGYVYKVNNLMNSKGIVPLFDRIRLHNQTFPSSRYEFVGFTGFDGGSVYPVFRQEYVNEGVPATPEEIGSYMGSLGFTPSGEAEYSNGNITISDLRPRNVLKDAEGDLYVIDADFRQDAGEPLQADGGPLQEPLQAGASGQSAMERIPKDEQGQPLYEQADPDTAWDAIVEETGGDEAMAQNVAASMVADKEAELKKAEKAKPKGGTTIAEKIAAERERKEAVEQAQANLAAWQKIAQTPERRKQAALLEQRKAAEEAARLRREQEEKERAEREEAERIRREALNGVPDFVEDTPQDARARGYRRVNGEKVDRQEPIEAKQGKEIRVKFDDKHIPTGHVALMDASQLQPSHLNGQRNPLHFIDEAQPKERRDDASVMSAQKIAAGIRPEEITSSVTAYTGAPTVNTRGEVIQGNNRSAALREMWAAYPEQAAKYKQYLTEHAADFGLAPGDVETMRQPVLVNMLDVPDEEAIALGQFVSQDTESGGTERIKPKNLVQRMGKDMGVFANRLLASTDEEASFAELVDSNGVDVLKWMQQKGYITPTQYKSAFDTKGNLTAEAKNDLKGVMYQGIFQNGSTTLEEMFGTLPAKAQKAILATAYRDYDSPNAERMVEEIQDSISAYYALSQDPAFAGSKNYKEARLAAEAWKRQLAFDDVTGESYLPSERFSNFALLLATMYKGQSQGFIQNTFGHIFDLVQGTQEATLFDEPDNTPRTLAEAINETLSGLSEELLLNGNFVYDGQRRSNVLAGGSAAGQERRQGSGGDAPSGGRDENGTRTSDRERRTVSADAERGRQGYLRHPSGRQPDNLEEAEERVRLSDEVDENGRPFVFSENGTTVFGEIREYSGLTPAPIKLSEGYQDENGKGYGLIHIDANHGEQIRKAGFNSVEDFVSYVATNYDEDNIRVGKRRYNGSPTFLIQVTDTHDNTLFIEMSIDGSYWNVNSAGIFRKGYSNKKETVVKTEPQQPNNAVSTGSSLSENEEGGITSSEPNGKPTVSDSKDSEKSRIDSTLGEKVAKAEEETATNPTEAQKEAGNYKKGHVRIGQFDITVENPKGSVRRGTDANGNKWEQTMQNTYGYIRGTEGVDGDHIDVFLGDDIDGWNGRRVYIVDQYNEDGTFDEHKVMLGFNDEAEAQDAYLANYEKGWENKRKLVMSSANLEDFEKWINSSHRKTKPFAEYKSVKKGETSGNKERENGNKSVSLGQEKESDGQREVGGLPGESGRIDGKNEAEAILRGAGHSAAAEDGRSGGTKESLLGELAEKASGSSQWIDDIQSIVSSPIGKGGENESYLSKDGKFAIKVNDFSYLPDNATNFDSFMNRVDTHNELFPHDTLTVLGFTRNSEGKVSVVLSQPYISHAREAREEEIDGLLEGMGFYTDMSGNWTDGTFEIADTKPDNVLVDEDGNLHFIDVLPYDSRKPGRMLVVPARAAGEPGSDAGVSGGVPGDMNVAPTRADAGGSAGVSGRVPGDTSVAPTRREADNDAGVSGSAAFSPASLRTAYESGNEEQIAEAERRMRAFIESFHDADGLRMVYGTYLQHRDFARRLKDDEMGRKMHRFIADSCKAVLGKAGLPAKAMQSERARVEVAGSSTDAHVLDVMSADRSYDVKMAVVKNPATSHATLERFVKEYSNNSLDFDARQELNRRKSPGTSEAGSESRTLDGFKSDRESVVQWTVEDLKDEYATSSGLSKTEEEIRKEAEELVDYNEESDLYMEVWDRLEGLVGPEGMDKLEADARKNGEDRLSLAAMIEEIERRENREQEEAQKVKQQSGPVEKIKDVGEKIGGAKKDRFKEFVEKEKQIQEKPDSFMEELRKLPVSKIFNFNLEALRKDGLSNEAATLIDIIRRVIPSKPRTDWKLKRWVSDVFGLYRFCLTLATAEQGTLDNVFERVTNIKQIGGMYRAQMALGGFDSGLDTGQATLEELGDSAGHYDKGNNWVSIKGQWYVTHAGRYSGIYPDYEKAKKALTQFAGESSKGKGKGAEVKFSVYSYKHSGESFITPQGKPGIVVESGFKSSKEALAYLNEHMHELQAKYRNMKDSTSIGFAPNSERRGKDWRGGKDVTAEDFRNTFGFRGVEFGNWTNQQERQRALNQAYDAFMDLSEATGISPRGLSLGGELGMAFGARGGGGAAAHYERGKVVINLTKTQGAGTLAHEWWHAIDNYFSRRRGQALGYNTERKGYGLPVRGGRVEREHEAERKEITDAFTALMKAINGSSYGERSNAYANLKSSYWKEPTELGARAFAVWVERKLSEKGIVNNFLANNNVIGWDSPELTQKYYPYPLESDFESLDAAFDGLFVAIEEKVDEETGNTVLYRLDDELSEVNERFNEELDGLTEENASSTRLQLGRPSNILLSVGVPDKPFILYGNKLIKKAQKHGFSPKEIKDLPLTMQHPIAVFTGSHPKSFAVLSEMKINGKNVLVSIETEKDGEIDFNIISSVFGKNNKGVIKWILDGKLLYADKEKALSYISASAPIADATYEKEPNSGSSENLHLAAPIAAASDSQELSVATKIVRNFENPSVSDENLRGGTGTLTDDDLSMANDPVSKLLGKSTRTARQRRVFAERERARMTQRVEELAEKLHLDNVEIVTDASTLQGNRAKAKGFYSRETGKITVVIPNHTSVFDAEQTLLHEAVAHYGLRQLFGEHFDTFLDNVFQNADEEVRGRIEGMAQKHVVDTRTATEEYLASLAEETNFEDTQSSWWRKIKELFLRMLHKIGFDGFTGVTLSDNELRYILWRSYENLAEPGRYRSILGEAADVAKQSELKVGNYAPRHADVGRVAEVSSNERLESVNRRFNEELDEFTVEEADKFYFDLGMPSSELLAAGVENRPIRLHGSKVAKKMRKHGFESYELKDLPMAVAHPVAVFDNLGRNGNRSILTELKTSNGNFLITIDLGRGSEADFDIVSSVFGKNSKGVVDWMNKGKMRYVDKEKALNYLHLAAPIAAASDNQELISAANIVRNFENPVILGEESVGAASEGVPGSDASEIGGQAGDWGVAPTRADGGGAASEGDNDSSDVLYRQSDTDVEAAVAGEARRLYEEAVKDTGRRSLVSALAWTAAHLGSKDARVRFRHKFSESYFDYTRSVKALQDAVEKSSGRKVVDFEDTWRAMNAKSSVDEVEIQEVMFRYVEPLTKHIGRMLRGREVDGKALDMDALERYLISKHGAERNALMAGREAERLAGVRMERWRKGEVRRLVEKEGYTYDEARAIVEEEALQKEETLRAEAGREARRDYAGLTALYGEEAGKDDVDALEAAASAYCGRFEAAVGAEQAEELWRLVRSLNGFSLRKAYLSGLISKRQFDEVSGMYRYYVPLRGWKDDYSGDIYQYVSRAEGSAVRQTLLRRAYGRKSRAANLVGTMSAMANTAVVQGNRNLVAQRFLNMAMNHGDTGLFKVVPLWYELRADGTWEISLPKITEGMTAEEAERAIAEHEEKMEAAEAEGRARRPGHGRKGGSRPVADAMGMHMAKWQEREHMIRALRGGREYAVYVLGDPKAAQAVNGLLNPDVEATAIEEVLMKFLRFKAQMQTSFSPEFMVSNFQRDVLTSTAGTYIKHGVDWARLYAGNLWRVLPMTPGKGGVPTGGIFTLVRKWRRGRLDASDEVERLFGEFVHGGGMTGISQLDDASVWQRRAERQVRRAGRGRVRNAPGEAARGFMRAVEEVNRGVENATRFAAYMTARQRGLNVTEAIAEAKEVSVNFNRKGSGAWGNLWMRRNIIYANAALQSLYMLGTWYGASPRRFMGVMGATLAASVATAMVWYLVGGGDGDDEGNDWYGLSEWNRYNYINLRGPEGYFHWNIPQELRPAWALGQIAFDLSTGRITQERALHAMAMQLNNVTPVSFIAGGTDTGDSWITSGIKAWTPTVAADFMDAYAWDEDFLGRRITGRTEWNSTSPEWQRVTEETPAWVVAASRGWNRLTGGRDNRKSWWDSEWLNPGALYYIMQQQAGGMGQLVTKTTKMVEQWRSPDEEVEARYVPFVSKFYVTTGDDYSRNRVLNDRFYQLWREYELAEHEAKANVRDLREGRMTREAYDEALRQMRDDGSLALFERIYAERLDLAYERLVKYVRENPDDERAREMLTGLKRHVLEVCGEEP